MEAGCRPSADLRGARPLPLSSSKVFPVAGPPGSANQSPTEKTETVCAGAHASRVQNLPQSQVIGERATGVRMTYRLSKQNGESRNRPDHAQAPDSVRSAKATPCGGTDGPQMVLEQPGVHTPNELRMAQPKDKRKTPGYIFLTGMRQQILRSDAKRKREQPGLSCSRPHAWNHVPPAELQSLGSPL